MTVPIPRFPTKELYPDPVALTVVGVIAPKVKDIAGVVVAVATVPETPLAVVTEAEVTVPDPAYDHLNKPVAES